VPNLHAHHDQARPSHLHQGRRAAGWTGIRPFTANRALIEHWDGTRWSTRPLPGIPRHSELRSVSCATGTRCTAVGATRSSGSTSAAMPVADLRGGRWIVSGLFRKAVSPGNGGLDYVACRGPRVCSAITRYISVAADTATWAIVSRGRTGGFPVQLLASRVAFDDPRDLSCSAQGCTLVGGKNDNGGRGDQLDAGSTLAWRSTSPSIRFAPQTTPPPPATPGVR
jgi:hypothetical protein